MIRFVLTGQARTGSTMLGSALGAHPDVVMHGELFGEVSTPLNFYGIDERLPWPTPLENYLKQLRDHDIVGFLERYVYAKTGRSAVGYKFKFEEFSRWPKVADYIERTRPKLIYIRRQNLWQRYLSGRETLITDSYNSADSISRSLSAAREQAPITPAEIQGAFEAEERLDHEFRTRFAPHPVLEVTYEDMLADFIGTMVRTCAFLEIDFVETVPFVTRRKAERKVHRLINFPLIRKHFAGTKYAQFFE